MKASRLVAFLIFVIALGLPSAALAAKTVPQPTAWQSVIGHAFAPQCVVAGYTTQIDFELYNQGNEPKIVVVWNYGVIDTQLPGFTSPQKGPMMDINTARSGLLPTADPYTYKWVLRIPPRQWVQKMLFVNRVPDNYGIGEMWDPAWGPRPVPRAFFSATADVRYSTSEIDMSAKPAYCPQL